MYNVIETHMFSNTQSLAKSFSEHTRRNSTSEKNTNNLKYTAEFIFYVCKNAALFISKPSALQEASETSF